MNNSDKIILSNASVTFIGLVFSYFMSFLSGIVITRMMGADEFGIFNVSRTLCETIAIFTKIGFDVGILRYLGEHYQQQGVSLSRISAVLNAVLVAVLLSSLIPVLLVVLGGGEILQNHVYHYRDFSLIMNVMVFTIPLMSLTQVLAGMLRGCLHSRVRVIGEYFLQPIVRFFIIVCLFYIGWRIWAAITGTVISFIVSTGYLWFIARRLFLQQASAREKFGFQEIYSDLISVGRYSIVISMSVIVMMLLAKTDILMLGYLSSADNVGKYSVAQMLVTLIPLFNTALNQAVAPMLATLARNESFTEMRRIVHQHSRWVIITTLPLFFIIAFYGNTLVLIFGKEFTVTTPVFIVLSLSLLVYAVLSSSATMLSMTGHHMAEFRAIVIGLIFNILLNYILIPYFGVMGAASATLMATLIASILRSMQALKLYGIFPVGYDSLRPALVGTMVFFAVYMAVDFAGMEKNVFNTAIVSLLFVIVYACLMFRFGVCHEDRYLLVMNANKIIGRFV